MSAAAVNATIHQPAALILGKLESWWEGFFLQLPNFVAAVLFLLAAYGVAKLTQRGIRRLAHRRDRTDFGVVIGSLVFAVVMIAAALVACVIVFPSVNPADALATLGIGSVAVGFAFKDILQNLFAGVLLLLRRPFRRGDQIIVKEYEGTVEHIESRATHIKTYDGRRVIIPNADIYTSPVTVNTSFPVRRDEYDVGIGYGDDLDLAMRVFTEAVGRVEEVVAEPAPEVLPWGLDASTVTLRARWWTGSKRLEIVHVKAKVIRAIFQAAKDNAIDLPFPTQVLLLHDQTEEWDGDRARQREGWPAGERPPRSRRATGGAARA